MLVDLLRPGTADLARRWVGALLTVDPADREALVAEVERRVASLYPLAPGADQPDAGSSLSGAADEPPAEPVDVVHPPRQRDGYVEQVRVTYERGTASPPPPAARATPSAPTPGARRVRSRG
ncbi:MAG: hypothetical protein SFY69_04550 [Planctomycetota bacterium]|nr:hypothetical protein [Planctomycetota bacterium]